MNPITRPRARLLLAAATLAVVMLPGLAGAGHDLTAPVDSFTGCLKGDKLESLTAGDDPATPCKADETIVHLSGGDITGVAAGVGLDGGSAEGGALLSLGLHQCTAAGEFFWSFGGGFANGCATVFSGNSGIDVFTSGRDRRVSLAEQQCEAQTLVNGIDAQGELICVSPAPNDNVGFTRALVDDGAVEKDDLVIENPGHEFFFRNAASFHVKGIAATDENPDGHSIDVDRFGVEVNTGEASLVVDRDGLAQIRNSEGSILLDEEGRVEIRNDNNGFSLNADGTMSTRTTTKVENLNADQLDGKSAEDFGIGFQRATADDPANNIKTGDLVISNTGAEFVFRDAASFHLNGIGATLVNPNGNSIDIDSFGIVFDTPKGRVTADSDGNFAIQNLNGGFFLDEDGRINISNVNNGFTLGSDGTMSFDQTTKVDNLNSDLLDGKSAEDFVNATGPASIGNCSFTSTSTTCSQLTASGPGSIGGCSFNAARITCSNGANLGAGTSVVGGCTFGSGTFSCPGGKSFRIDHPLEPGKLLAHAAVEAPELQTVYSGNVRTNGLGAAVVKLPRYFEALNRDYRYQLTVIGSFAQAIVAKEIADNRFTIRTSKPNVKVSWQVTGVRNDAYARAHPLVVETAKATR